MTVAEFIAKWQRSTLTERASAQSHFNDICRLVAHPEPAEADPGGTWFTFERGATKATGGEGWADVWKRGAFGWEYKGRHKDLNAAYVQLLMYQGALESPPVLVTSDTDRIVIHTHFPNTPTRRIELTLEGLSRPEQFAQLRALFHELDRLRPETTIQQITEEAARKVTDIAQALRSRGLPPERVARFLDRVVFCLFAEDIGLLPNRVFSRLIESTQGEPGRFRAVAADLFQRMADGGYFGAEKIEHFNGNLFHATEALDLTAEELRQLHEVGSLDWSNIDASIFGTLFERALDPDKRSQLGAHYTSREDIELIVDPVVMVPLRREWAQVREQFDALMAEGEDAPRKDWNKARGLVRGFLDRLAGVTVLDPACGSGNFLYVTLQKLKDLEKEVIVHAARYYAFFPQVGPWQLRGIEVNRYAYELAQMTVWIGHLQWHQRNGMPLEERPILRPMTNFECKDAVLALDGDGLSEPEWPDAEFIVSNPPFLGVRKLRGGLGDAYVEALFTLWGSRVRSESDYCCYWFEKARAQVAIGKCRRVGLLATQGIRSGASRNALRRIKETGDIFFGVADREWVLDGATVHVAMVGFDDGSERERHLDGELVTRINADLTSGTDVTEARRLVANEGRSFMADTKGGAFDVSHDVALGWLQLPNPNGRPNSDVLRPWVNGLDIGRRPRLMWIIDFPPGTSEASAAGYEAPFEHLRCEVYPTRKSNRRVAYAERWWMHVEPRPEMRRELAGQLRYLATQSVSKHRLFVWLPAETLPDHQLIVFAWHDDYALGLLHSRLHELWARATGSQLREAESGFRYTPTSTFETFPFPSPDRELMGAVTMAARELDVLRSRWLNPPEWVREESVSFLASAEGPWAHLVTSANAEGAGTATYRWLVPADEDVEAELKKRTLTNLYNKAPAWLLDAHRALDEAVFAAYGWRPTMSDEEVLAALLELNLDRAGEQ